MNAISFSLNRIGRPIAVEALPQLSAAVRLLGRANARGRSYVEKSVGHDVSLSLRRNLSATPGGDASGVLKPPRRRAGSESRFLSARDDVEEVREHVLLGDNRDYLHYLSIGEPSVFDRLQIGVADLAARLSDFSGERQPQTFAFCVRGRALTVESDLSFVDLGEVQAEIAVGPTRQ